MKKKLMMVAVLLGALSLGACVDDNESASVTAIRNAKAAQLEALANLSNAQAEAEAIRAAAEAAYQNALAAYQQALADAKNADTEYYTEKYKLELEKLAAEYQAEIAEAKYNQANWESQEWNAINSQVGSLYNDYTNALSQIYNLSEELIEKQFDLSMVDVEDEAAQAYYDKLIAGYNQDIVDKTAQIERLKSLNTDKAALETQLNDLTNQAYDLIQNQKPAAEKAEDEAEEAYNDVYKPINRNFYSSDQHEMLEWEASKLAYVKAIDTLFTVQNDASVYGLVDYNTEEVKAVEGCYETATVATYALSEGSDYLAATQNIARWFADEIESQENYIGHASDADATPAVSATGLYENLEYWQGVKKTADDNLAAEQAKTNPDASLIEQYTEESQNAQVEILRAQESIANAQIDLADIKAKQKSYEENLAVAVVGTDAQKEYVAAVEAAVKAREAWLVASHEVHKIDNAIDVIGIVSFNNDGNVASYGGGEYGIVIDLYDDATTVEEQIMELEEDIAELKETISKVGADGGGNWVTGYGYYYDTESGNWLYGQVEMWVSESGAKITAEEAKALIQMEIDNIKAEIAAYEKRAEMYKAELEALIGDIDEEETPAA